MLKREKKILLGSYYKYWSYKYFNPCFLDQPAREGNFPTTTYNRKRGVVKNTAD